jgi:S-adenosylmethionine:tRNA ribosyltransferase-isomerase
MEKEYFKISEKAAQILNATRAGKGRIICVGTTTCRALETVVNSLCSSSPLRATCGWTKLFIYPPYEFKLTDSLLTNFHLPRTTLLMLVSAFSDREILFRAYRQAIERKYRFYSYGDAMLII